MIGITFTSGETVYSKRCGHIAGFDGVIVEKRGNGYQVLNPKTGELYQRDHYDLLPIEKKAKAEAAA